MTELSLDIVGFGLRTLNVRRAVIAGWTSRDQAAVDNHIAELKELGVAPPSTVPLYYRVGVGLVTATQMIETVGATGSGEVEPVLIDDGQELFLGLGSDHTDRALESHSVALSKQVCPKPIAPLVWRFQEVKDHLDSIEFKSWIRDDDEDQWTPYQSGTLSQIRPLEELVAGSPVANGDSRLASGSIMMCGTFAILGGGIRSARQFRMEMRDPTLDRVIDHAYRTNWLPVVS